ncbi:MAG: hypothetical protein WDW38_008195 [Sanguina aurantia]
MAGHANGMCFEVHPTKEEFSQPFSKYVKGIFRKYPDLPMFKVIPPKGWKPRKSAFPDLSEVPISVPIRQHAFGTKGAYRCLFMEAKPMTAADFKRTSEEEEAVARGMTSARSRGETRSSKQNQQPPNSIEVGQNRQLLAYGWNLGSLGDLLDTHNVDPIPGVTTPMVYFGMWRSFFGWHKEDADLYSINFHHWGAPKVWYCVAPSHRAKFERMAEGLFPELHKACPAFIRHKDIMISPALLRTYHIPYIQAHQQPGEFVVLNSAAYHSGFNTGLNCAEAVNFALQDWVPLGKVARPCKCSALADSVRINMKLFDPKWVDPYATSDDESDDDSGSTDEDHPSNHHHASASPHVCSSRCTHAAPAGSPSQQHRGGPSAPAAAAAAAAAVRLRLSGGAKPGGGGKRKAGSALGTGTSAAAKRPRPPAPAGPLSPAAAAAAVEASLGQAALTGAAVGKGAVGAAELPPLRKRILAAQLSAANLLARSRYMAARARATTARSSTSSLAGQLLAKGRATAAATKARDAAARVELMTRAVRKEAASAGRLAAASVVEQGKGSDSRFHVGGSPRVGLGEGRSSSLAQPQGQLILCTAHPPQWVLTEWWVQTRDWAAGGVDRAGPLRSQGTCSDPGPVWASASKTPLTTSTSSTTCTSSSNNNNNNQHQPHHPEQQQPQHSQQQPQHVQQQLQHQKQHHQYQHQHHQHHHHQHHLQQQQQQHHLQQQQQQPSTPTTAAAALLPIASPAALAHHHNMAVAPPSVRSGAPSSQTRGMARNVGELEGCPAALVGQDRKGQRFFYLVQRLRGATAGTFGKVSLRWLSEGGDGLWRPLDGTSCEEHSAALIQVQAAQVEGTRQAAGGWRLLTAHRSILETRLAGAGGPTDPPDSTCVGRTQGVGRGQTGCGAVTSMGVGPGKGSAPAPQACLSSLMHGTDPGVESGGVCRPVVTTSRPGA